MSEQNPLARAIIPSVWGEQGKCIWCGAQPLTVLHPPEAPDQLMCPQCQMAYEIDKTGALICIRNQPESMKVDYQNLWIPITMIAEAAADFHKQKPKQRIPIPVEEFVYQGNNAVLDSETHGQMQQFKEEESAPLVELTDEQVKQQVIELYNLGNTSEQIQRILDQRYRYSQLAFDRAFESITKEKEIRQKLALQKAAIFLAVVLVMLVIIGFMMRKLYPLILIIIQDQLNLFGFSS
ncbi:MAG: hypothetical protein ABFD58_12910 [Anaerolineaceae bacterium]